MCESTLDGLDAGSTRTPSGRRWLPPGRRPTRRVHHLRVPTPSTIPSIPTHDRGGSKGVGPQDDSSSRTGIRTRPVSAPGGRRDSSAAVRHRAAASRARWTVGGSGPRRARSGVGLRRRALPEARRLQPWGLRSTRVRRRPDRPGCQRRRLAGWSHWSHPTCDPWPPAVVGGRRQRTAIGSGHNRDTGPRTSAGMWPRTDHTPGNRGVRGGRFQRLHHQVADEVCRPVQAVRSATAASCSWADSPSPP